ncbi:MAG: RlmE family RNA methyltransferase [Candidatus Bathyarchaeota archaeon]|nr:RlmE family RNA methyltransferase [Candidatus Bathyarchaeota archaeon]
MPKTWASQRRKEYYYRKAKEEEYRSRATYKLLQAVQKYHFIKKGDIVLDLGAAPGGWLQATRRIVGKEGFILGVDLKEIAPLNEKNVLTIVSDIINPETHRLVESILPSLADAVVSDVSPRVSGIWEIDHARQVGLARMSLVVALKVLRANGNFFVKVFQGDMLKDFVEDVKKYFLNVRIAKPKASRPKSSEIFVLGRGFLGTRDSCLE